DRGPACTLLVYVDDATSRLMQLLFVSSESTFTYFEATRGYLERYGKPLAFYSDKASVFRINNKQATGGDGQTQFGRAMNELNITGICANTSSAKGRVERAHLTLQDRLVKELRLRGISTPEAANAFADEFMEDYNRRFAKPPRHDFDVHRQLDNGENLQATFTWREQRKVSKNLTLQYDKKLYLLEDNEENRRFQGKYIEVWQYPDGDIELRASGTSLPFTTYDRLGELDQGAIIDNKRLGRALEMIKLVQDKRDNTRSQALPSLDGQTSRRKKQPGKKSQRSLDHNDMLEALQQLQTRSKDIFGKG
ncbi:ISNCY family transposase, partial [Klebsiella oxytoca]